MSKEEGLLGVGEREADASRANHAHDGRGADVPFEAEERMNRHGWEGQRPKTETGDRNPRPAGRRQGHHRLRGYVFNGFRIKLRSEEHTSELQSHLNLVCRLLLEKKQVYS